MIPILAVLRLLRLKPTQLSHYAPTYIARIANLTVDTIPARGAASRTGDIPALPDGLGLPTAGVFLSDFTVIGIGTDPSAGLFGRVRRFIASNIRQRRGARILDRRSRQLRTLLHYTPAARRTVPKPDAQPTRYFFKLSARWQVSIQ